MKQKREGTETLRGQREREREKGRTDELWALRLDTRVGRKMQPWADGRM